MDVDAMAAAAFMHGAIEYNTPLEDCLQAVCYDELGIGMNERVYELIRWAKPLALIAKRLWEIDFGPGVYHYEVSEPFGIWWARQVVDLREFPSDANCWAKITDLVFEYAQPAGDGELSVIKDVIDPVWREHSDT